jgi:hypothetical protein
VSASGNATVKASSIQVVGKVQNSGNASFSPLPVTGASFVPNPLADLTGPSTTGLTNYGAANISGTTVKTLNPGIYSQISVSGSATVTFNPGLYLIEGGGFTVSGKATVSGQRVTIYNTSSNYPNNGSYGGITLSGTGSINLTAPTTGPYAGIVIFQPSANTRALSLSGNVTGLAGTLYAPSAQVVLSGNAQLNAALVVDRLSLSGNGASTQVADGSAGSALDTASSGTLLAGNLFVYVSDPAGYFTLDELNRIQDAITTWDSLLAPYSVTITEVSDSTLANVILDNGTTSAAGSPTDGVLGSYSSTGEITILQGWNWYDGADLTQIGTNQYDFQTVVTHELGHALGLGGSENPSSPMYEILASGVVQRTPTVADLNIPEAPDGADPERAAPRPPESGSSVHPGASAVVRSTPAMIETAAPASASGSITVGFVNTTINNALVPQARSGGEITTANLPTSRTPPLFVATGPSSGTVGDAAVSPSTDEPAPDWLDRLFQEEAISPEVRDLLPRNQEAPNWVDQLAPLLADSQNAAICRADPSTFPCADFAAVSARTDLEGLVIALLSAYGYTQLKEAETRRAR